MTAESANPYDQLISRTREANLLASTSSLLHWDQQTMMPTGGLEHRSKQLSQLARMAHAMATDPAVGQLLGACEADAQLQADPTSVAAVNVREIRRDFERATKLPPELVAELASTGSVAQAHWQEARKLSDFSRFRPWFEKLLALKKREAECLGWDRVDGEPWDALADEYEPGCTAKSIEAIFTPLRQQLVDLLDALGSASAGPSERLIRLHLPTDPMKRFVREVSERMGFDFARGRLDESTHPFCGGTHCHDVRMTTRFSETNPIEPLYSTIHESGHGMYEQNLPDAHIGTPMGHSVSLGIHESQSRMWENLVGRSRAFWVWCLPLLRDCFGPEVQSLSVDEAFAGANIIRPGFIRVEADEATYNLHLMVRFEIERALMKGDIEVADVPDVWNQKVKRVLGLEVPDDARGCLQDIHWSSGSIGYFPTYTLGNLYAAQFFEKARADIPDLYEQFESGRFDGLRSWLSENIHQHGMRYRAAELCEQVTGASLSAAPLMRHLEGKLKPLYGL